MAEPCQQELQALSNRCRVTQLSAAPSTIVAYRVTNVKSEGKLSTTGRAGECL